MGSMGGEQAFMPKSMSVSVVDAVRRVVGEASSFRRDSVRGPDSRAHRLELSPACLAEGLERIGVFRACERANCFERQVA